MDTEALALKLRRLNSWIQFQEGYGTLEVHRLASGPYGRAQITIDATATSPAASLNHNRIYLCGDGNGLTLSGLQVLVAEYEFRHIERCFVWLSPGPNMDSVRGWLSSLGFNRVTWTRYPTLLHSSAAAQSQFSALEVRQVSVDEVARARPLLGEAMMDGYCKTAGKQGFQHYVAYDDGQPIAAAALVAFEGIGYLTYAGTIASARRRGAQTALILRRIDDGRSLGCTHIVSQTLTMLGESLANLQRCGFREVYEQEVYERSSQPKA